MLQQSLLASSWRVFILEEHDRRLVRASDTERLRWDDLDRVSARMMALPFELVVAKPLAESHRAGELLDSIGRSRGIWMLRHYRAVARSNLERFGVDNGFRDLQILVETGQANWRGKVTEEVREHVAKLLASALSPLDAAAVFWWARNQLYMDQDLARDDRIRVMHYETMMESAHECLQALSEFVGLRLPLGAMERQIRPIRAENGELSPNIEVLCGNLMEKFENVPDLARH